MDVVEQPADLPLPRLPPRKPASHKGSFGRCLLIGGSRDMSGAISLAGMAALRAGAGLVRLAVPGVCQAIVAGHEPSYMTVPLASDNHGRIQIDFHGNDPPQSGEVKLGKLLDWPTTVGCGPGLGRSDSLDEWVVWLYRHLPRPAVFDADGLNALSARSAALAAHQGPRVLTPHPGEFGRLLGKSPREVLADRETLAAEFAAHTGAIVVVKGHRTLITDGSRLVANRSGNPGLATGGSGDVLTGVITALLGQGLDPFDAARLGVYLHGLAGDLAAADLGQVSMMASDLLHYLPGAFQQLG